MALKITEVGGKLLLEGNINSVTEKFLKQHIQMIRNAASPNNKHMSKESMM